MKRVLVLDGGGAKGVIQSTIIKEIEAQIGKPCHEIFDLIVGTSVGAILGSILASGKVTGEECHAMVKDNLAKVFKKRLFRMPKYSRKALNEAFESAIGKGFRMGDCCTPFVCTAVNMVDGRTHYFKSWERQDSHLLLVDAVTRSYAAPFFFGAVKDEVNQSVWLDGGTGNANNPLLEAVIETIRQEWMNNEPVHILNIGTGYHNYAYPYAKASRSKTLRQLSFYMNPGDGGLARNQSILSRVAQVDALSKCLDNFTYQRLDKEISERLDTLDGVRFMTEYEEIGKSLLTDIDWDKLSDKTFKPQYGFYVSQQVGMVPSRGVSNAI